MKKINAEKLVRNILISLTIISLIILFLNFTFAIYDNMNVEKLNNLLVNYINTWVMWIDCIFIYIFGIIYIVVGIKSKEEVALKVSFSVFSILTNMVSISFIINFIADIFGVFN